MTWKSHFTPEQEETLARAGKLWGEENVPSLQVKPKLSPRQLEIMEVYYFLSVSRPQGFGFSFIPLSEIESYCRLCGVPDPEFLTQAIRQIDISYVSALREKESDD